MAAKNSKLAEEREKTADLQAYLLRKRTEKNAWTEINRDKVHKQAKETRARAKASGKHRCAVRDTNFASKTALKKHEDGLEHLEAVRAAAGGAPKAVSAATQRSRNFLAKNRDSKKFHCVICDMSFGTKAYLKNHTDNSKRHKAKAAKWEELNLADTTVGSSSAPPSTISSSLALSFARIHSVLQLGRQNSHLERETKSITWDLHITLVNMLILSDWGHTAAL